MAAAALVLLGRLFYYEGTESPIHVGQLPRRNKTNTSGPRDGACTSESSPLTGRRSVHANSVAETEFRVRCFPGVVLLRPSASNAIFLLQSWFCFFLRRNQDMNVFFIKLLQRNKSAVSTTNLF